jgi:hypothetical protein
MSSPPTGVESSEYCPTPKTANAIWLIEDQYVVFTFLVEIHVNIANPSCN